VIARVRVLGNRLAPCTHHAIKHRMPIFAVLLQGLLDTPATAKREAFWRGKALAVDAPGAKTHHRYKETWPPIANADAVDSPSWRVKSSRVEDLIALSWCCIYGAPLIPLPRSLTGARVLCCTRLCTYVALHHLLSHTARSYSYKTPPLPLLWPSYTSRLIPCTQETAI
jgi:hypothetical protein